MIGVCELCGAHGSLEIHHIVGRLSGTPIHHGLVIKACGPCNNRQFLLWTVAGLAAREPPEWVLVRRAALFLAIRNGPLDAELADFLTDHAEHLELAA